MFLLASSCIDSLVLKPAALARVIRKPRQKRLARNKTARRMPPARLPMAIPASAPLDSEEDVAVGVAGDVVGLTV